MILEQYVIFLVDKQKRKGKKLKAVTEFNSKVSLFFFYLPVSYLKPLQLKYTKLQFYLLFCMAVELDSHSKGRS
jgi:hypothetical protein